jgi:hypothetical protein
MSIGFEYSQYPDAISKMIKDEQIKVTGESFNRGTPPLTNMERSGMLVNVWRVRRNQNDSVRTNR